MATHFQQLDRKPALLKLRMRAAHAGDWNQRVIRADGQKDRDLARRVIENCVRRWVERAGMNRCGCKILRLEQRDLQPGVAAAGEAEAIYPSWTDRRLS